MESAQMSFSLKIFGSAFAPYAIGSAAFKIPNS